MGTQFVKFKRISLRVSRPSAQQGSPNGTSSALKICFFKWLSGPGAMLRMCWASGLNMAGFHTGIVAPTQSALFTFFTLSENWGWSQEAPSKGPNRARPLEPPCLGACMLEKNVL